MAQLKRNNPYIMVDAEMLDSEMLSLGAKGLLCKLYLYPDDREVTIEELLAGSTNDRDSLMEILNELEEQNYIKRVDGADDSETPR